MAEWLKLRHAMWLRDRAARLLKKAIRLRARADRLTAHATEIERDVMRLWHDVHADRVGTRR